MTLLLASMDDNLEIFRQRNLSAIKGLRDLVQFALDHTPHGRWHSYAFNAQMVESVCSAVNLGIIKINEFDQFSLKSAIKAILYLEDSEQSERENEA